MTVHFSRNVGDTINAGDLETSELKKSPFEDPQMAAPVVSTDKERRLLQQANNNNSSNNKETTTEMVVKNGDSEAPAHDIALPSIEVNASGISGAQIRWRENSHNPHTSSLAMGRYRLGVRLWLQ